MATTPAAATTAATGSARRPRRDIDVAAAPTQIPISTSVQRLRTRERPLEFVQHALVTSVHVLFFERGRELLQQLALGIVELARDDDVEDHTQGTASTTAQ